MFVKNSFVSGQKSVLIWRIAIQRSNLWKHGCLL